MGVIPKNRLARRKCHRNRGAGGFIFYLEVLTFVWDFIFDL
jgi:hypothetical protein